MSSDESLCYIEAAQQYEAGKISFQKYIRYLFAHVNGTRHVADEGLNSFDVQSVDTFASCVEYLANTLQEPIGMFTFDSEKQISTVAVGCCAVD